MRFVETKDLVGDPKPSDELLKKTTNQVHSRLTCIFIIKINICKTKVEVTEFIF